MLWNILAVLGIVIGFYLIREALDTLLAWRAWFLGISGLSFIFLGCLKILLHIRRNRADQATD